MMQPARQTTLRLRALVWVMRFALKPLFSVAKEPTAARRGFAIASAMFRRPRGVQYRWDRDNPPKLWVDAGAVNAGQIILFFHGGGYIAGHPRGYLALLGRIAVLTGLQVAAPAYRLAPEHPAPAAFDEARRAHAALMAAGWRADQIILGGDSAGGGLALALLADLCARDLRPAGLFAFSPWTDLAMTGASVLRNAAADPILPAARMPDLIRMVMGDLEPTDPRISPLFADFALPPPVMIQVGTTEILFDDARRMVERLQQSGGDAVLSEWAGAPHVWQLLDGYVPEARAALTEMAAFVRALPNPLPRQRSGS